MASPKLATNERTLLAGLQKSTHNVSVTASLHFIQPCSPVTAKSVPAGDGWLHEIELDGYRLQAAKDGLFTCCGVGANRLEARYLYLPNFEPRSDQLPRSGAFPFWRSDRRPIAPGECRDWRKVKTLAWREANRERWRLFECA